MKPKRTAMIALLCSMVFLMTGCSQPLPADKRHYAGHWQGDDMSLLITLDGRVSYKRYGGGLNKSIDAPLTAFHGDNFEVGLGFVTTLFEVQQPPVEEGGTWTMVVDGVELTRVNSR